jgi:hypothetical protein
MQSCVYLREEPAKERYEQSAVIIGVLHLGVLTREESCQSARTNVSQKLEQGCSGDETHHVDLVGDFDILLDLLAHTARPASRNDSSHITCEFNG